MNSGYKTDPTIARAYQQLKRRDAGVAVSAEVSSRIASYARHPGRNSAWIWPLSLAASALISVTLMYQLAQVLDPAPLPAQPRFQPLVIAPLPPAIPGAVGQTSLDDSRDRQLRPVIELATAQDWWQQLRLHATAADRAAFLATWQAYQKYQEGVPLPADLNRWIAENGLQPNPNHSG